MEAHPIDLATFTGTPRSGKVTPAIFVKDHSGVEDTFRRNSVDGELSFLTEDDNNLSGNENKHTNVLSATTSLMIVHEIDAQVSSIAIKNFSKCSLFLVFPVAFQS